MEENKMNNDILNELEGVFNDVESADNLFENLTDGEYLAEIVGAEYKESKAGNPMVQIATKVIHGEAKGRQHSRFLLLNGRDDTALKRNLNAFAVQMRTLGVDTSKGLQATFDSLDELEGMEVIVKIETVKANNGNEYTNTYIKPADE